MKRELATAIAAGLNNQSVRVPCHYPKCKAVSAPASNYCKKHGKIVRQKYEQSK